MMRNTCFAILIGAALVGAACAGCDSESSKKYDVDVFWQIAGADVCTANPGVGTVDELTFNTVRISVYEDQGSTTTIQTADVDCSDFSYTIEGLKRGNYWVRVDAMAQIEGDDEPLPYYQSEQEILAPSDADYPEGYKFALEVGRATVEVRWDFDQVGYSCVDYGVEDVDISIADEIVPCNGDNGQIYVVEDVSWNTYTIAIDGLDADGNPVAHGDYNDGNEFEIKPRDYVDGDAIIVVLSEI
jgi:hypothetical protein